MEKRDNKECEIPLEWTAGDKGWPQGQQTFGVITINRVIDNHEICFADLEAYNGRVMLLEQGYQNWGSHGLLPHHGLYRSGNFALSILNLNFFSDGSKLCYRQDVNEEIGFTIEKISLHLNVKY